MKKEVRVRFAPSPTGHLHLGGVRTALYNFLYARQQNGTFILRIEDTDQTRYVENSVENLINSLKELGIEYDEGPAQITNHKSPPCPPHKCGGEDTPTLASSGVGQNDLQSYFQSQRLELYHKHVNELLQKGLAYRCYCTKETLEEMRNEQSKRGETTKYDGRCRELKDSKDSCDRIYSVETNHVVRLKIPKNRVFRFHDLVRGEIEISSEELEDQVILKSDGFPTYHLAAVVDDHYMNISHVLRGEEWLYSTPKHVFLYEALGWEPPIWVHLPLLLNTDKTKLSKRHGDFSVANYLQNGYLKEAIINFVALLGWHSSDDKELYTIEELINEFSLERITKSGAVFDITKLDWMNGWYIRNLPLEYIAELCREYFVKSDIDISDDTKYLKVIKRIREQVVKLTEIVEQAKVFYRDFVISEENLEIVRSETSQKVLKWFIVELRSASPNVVSELASVLTRGDGCDISALLKRASDELGIKGKNLFFPLRIALFGDCHGPDIPLLIDILGIEESQKRIEKIISNY